MPTVEDCEKLLHAMRGVDELRRAYKGSQSLKGTASLGVLAALDTSGSMRVSELADQMHVDISVMSRHVAHLEADGHVKRTPDPHDKRSSHVALTSQGKSALRTARKQVATRLSVALEAWPDGDVEQLSTLLDRFAADIHRMTPVHNTASTN